VLPVPETLTPAQDLMQNLAIAVVHPPTLAPVARRCRSAW
jgi:hypothetical protein